MTDEELQGMAQAIAGLDPIQRKIWDFIVEFKGESDGNSPSYKEIMGECGLSSTSEVSRHLQALAAADLIRTDSDGRSRGIRVAGGQWELSPQGLQAVLLADHWAKERANV